MIPKFDHISEPDKIIMARKMILSYIQQVIKESKINQSEVAQQMGIKPEALSRMLKGKFSPTLDMLLRLCDVVGCYPFIIAKESDDDLAVMMANRWVLGRELN